MKKPILYIQVVDKNKIAFDFCYSAMMGAIQSNIKVKRFKDSSEVPGDPTNIIVGSVEQCVQWLEQNKFKVPGLIDVRPFEEFMGRTTTIMDIEDVKSICKDTPVFIKPADTIKAFTGFVADSPFTLQVWSHGYQGDVLVQPVIEIVSEYRLYVNCHKIIGMKHYRGDCLAVFDRNLIQKCVDLSYKLLDNHSYTLDFGVLEDGSTVLIECNDGWACGNYGIEPLDYYIFVRNRWLQLTNIRHRMEH
jgi:hypothetical protein